MLQFLIFLSWLVVFCSPLIFSLIKDSRGGEVSQKQWLFSVIWAVGGGVFILLIAWILHLWTEVLWFEELGYAARFWTVFLAKWKYFLLGAVGCFLFFWVNIRFTRATLSPEIKEEINWLYPFTTAGSFLLFALCLGALVVSRYMEFLLYQNQVPFDINDPIFGKNVGFYVFTLPVLKFLWKVLSGTVILAAFLVGLIYASQYNANFCNGEEKTRIRYRAITHISILGIILMVIFIFATRISIWNLLFSARGAVFGAGWTDVHIQIGAYWFFIGALVLAAVFLLISAIARSIRVTEGMAVLGFGVCFLTWLIGVQLVPAIIQHFVVTPNELVKETEYIKYNIAFTRQAYGLTEKEVTQSEFPVNMEISPEILTRDQATLKSIRLWDWRVLQAINSQNQAFRLYYTFPDVDVVRYRIKGQLVQMMYSSRELDQERLAPQSQTWLNTRMVYTHGFGGCANPVNIFTAEGLPDYWIKDIPPISKYPELQIGQPRIYFGEKTLTHVYVKTKQAEFDFPKGDQNVTFFYDGPAGIELGSGLRKFAFALRFDGIRLLTSRELTPQSRIMFRRDIETRVKTLAPFLMYDNDDYQIVALNGIWIIWDAYTTTKNYPYSEPYGDFNYIRNSVKVVMNCYTGKVDFYVFDDKDPLIKAYQKIFPGFFKPASVMPPELRQHIRYPEDLLRIQGEIYSTYHMTNPTVFYNREDAWEIANESSHGVTQKVLPYYIVMTVPGEKEEEFIQMLPFTPLTTDKKNPRNNMVSWLAGRCDGAHYGKLILYKFPKERLIYGPLQIGIRINQDEVISKDFTLWGQGGSEVVSGNLLVIPLSGYRLLYVQPIYLQAEVGKMPELKRVVVVSGDKLAYGRSFNDALSQLVGEGVVLEEVEKEVGVVVSTRADDLIKEAARHLELYRQLTGQGRFTEAGKKMEQLSRILNKFLEEK